MLKKWLDRQVTREIIHRNTNIMELQENQHLNKCNLLFSTLILDWNSSQKIVWILLFHWNEKNVERFAYIVYFIFLLVFNKLLSQCKRNYFSFTDITIRIVISSEKFLLNFIAWKYKQHQSNKYIWIVDTLKLKNTQLLPTNFHSKQWKQKNEIKVMQNCSTFQEIEIQNSFA